MSLLYYGFVLYGLCWNVLNVTVSLIWLHPEPNGDGAADTSVGWRVYCWINVIWQAAQGCITLKMLFALTDPAESVQRKWSGILFAQIGGTCASAMFLCLFSGFSDLLPFWLIITKLYGDELWVFLSTKYLNKHLPVSNWQSLCNKTWDGLSVLVLIFGPFVAFLYNAVVAVVMVVSLADGRDGQVDKEREKQQAGLVVLLFLTAFLYLIPSVLFFWCSQLCKLRDNLGHAVMLGCYYCLAALAMITCLFAGLPTPTLLPFGVIIFKLYIDQLIVGCVLPFLKNA